MHSSDLIIGLTLWASLSLTFADEVEVGEDGFFVEESSTEPTPAPEEVTFDADGFFSDEDAPAQETPKHWYERIDMSGSIGFEQRAFFQEGKFDNQLGHWQPSLIWEPEFFFETANRKDQFRLSPFLRYDFRNNERTHFDLREANWRHVHSDWDLLVGVDKVFWGVTESRHLVDIINQTDAVEDIDNEDKLGQPMVNLNWTQDWGTLSLFVMPYFRERTFPRNEGRLRAGLTVDVDDPLYESSAEEWHLDAALRYKHAIGNWDLGASFFHGTSREPTFTLSEDPTEWRPHYEIINQFGIDLQYTQDAWLWKLEAVAREGHGDPFAAVGGGFEYTFYQVGDSSSDISILTEYLWDGRDDEGPPTASQNDLFLGARWALNDPQDTALLLATVLDLDGRGAAAFAEFERRLGKSWFLELEARFVFNGEDDRALHSIADDSFATVRLSYNY